MVRPGWRGGDGWIWLEMDGWRWLDMDGYGDGCVRVSRVIIGNYERQAKQ